MNFEEKNPQNFYFLIVPSMGETKELVILPLVSDLARKKKTCTIFEIFCFPTRNVLYTLEEVEIML